jgi:Ca-activated chloride channel homolog
MLKFGNEIYIWLFTLVPIIMALFLLFSAKKKKSLDNFAEKELLNKLLPNKSRFKSSYKFILLLLALLSLTIAIMNPKIGTRMEEIKREGVEIIIAFDISNSMMAEDIKPNRLQRAKQSVINLLGNLYGDRIGIILFAGESFLQLPLTTDYSAAKLLISTISTDLIPTQGTAIGSAIEMAMDSFSDTETNKVLIIITDGENHEDDALGKAKEASEKGIFINTIGMGSEHGGPIPEYENSRRTGWKKDKSGNTVVSKLNPGMLSQIASAGGGKFIRSGSASTDLKLLIDDLENIEKSEFESKVFADYEDQFQYFIGLSIFFLIIELLTSNKKNKWIWSLVKFAEGSEGKKL